MFSTLGDGRSLVLVGARAGRGGGGEGALLPDRVLPHPVECQDTKYNQGGSRFMFYFCFYKTM